MSEVTPIRLVLDTNVVIDWLVFDDAFMNPLRSGVRDARVQVLTHPPAVVELERVLAYPQLKLDSNRQHAIIARYKAETVIAPMPSGFSTRQLMLPGGFPRCRDRDDEPFLALAFHAKADVLASRDNAVFGLKSRAAKFGVTILNVQQLIAMLSDKLENSADDPA
ncbi:MAG: putative toxin-antitoxin system toxin component, PIN family [Burkholderiales bacterium]|nr:putative toxin-antitoxin system toxin component, PIN family [Burkholderiales bacterium]